MTDPLVKMDTPAPFIKMEFNERELRDLINKFVNQSQLGHNVAVFECNLKLFEEGYGRMKHRVAELESENKAIKQRLEALESQMRKRG